MRFFPFGEEVDFQWDFSPGRLFGLSIINLIDRHFVFSPSAAWDVGLKGVSVSPTWSVR